MAHVRVSITTLDGCTLDSFLVTDASLGEVDNKNENVGRPMSDASVIERIQKACGHVYFEEVTHSG